MYFVLNCIFIERLVKQVRDITVAMAIYKPNLTWLKEELQSIKNQTYQHFEVLVWNDCPEDCYDYNSFFSEVLGDIPFKIYKGEKNEGSNKAFECLTEKVETKYIAYCDQDDIWLPNKLEVLREFLLSPDNTLAFSDMMVIDKDSNITARHIQEVRPRQIFYSGKDAFQHLLAKNFVTGCTMLMKTQIAKAAIPFPNAVFHDWWLAIAASLKGDIVMANSPLMKYRIYGGNQSAVLRGIDSKKDYFLRRIVSQNDLIKQVDQVWGPDLRIDFAKEWTEARIKYFNHPSLKDLRILLSMKSFNRTTVLFECLLPFFPEFLFKYIIHAVQRGQI